MSKDTSKSLVCIKIGGSVITDKRIAYSANEDAIRAIARVLKKVKAPLLIGHGSGSFGHTSAKIYGGKNGYSSKEGIAKVARDAQEINRIVMNIFIEEGLSAISFSPRSFTLSDKGNPDRMFFPPIDEALEQGLIPVVYGDVIWDSSQKTTILSGETILNAICKHLKRRGMKITSMIQLCDVDGVFDAQMNLIPEITRANWERIQSYLEELKVADVTGGMKHKVSDALQLATFGVATTLINGRSSLLLDAIHGKPVKGTVIR